MRSSFDQFQSEMQIRREHLNHVLTHYISELQIEPGYGIVELKKSMEYSLLQKSKRFRPLLCFLVAEAFGRGSDRVLPFACAIEMIHTYSLIHDDLPCMDDDDYRRGEPTNHKIFGEATALLAGDALLTESFALIAGAYSTESENLVGKLVQLLATAAGINGMVGGQSLDLKAQLHQMSLKEIETVHAMKTGALIRVSAEGSAIICGLPEDKVISVRKFGSELGLAFQLADDLLDSTEDNIETNSFPNVLGLDGTKKYLQQVSQMAHDTLVSLEIKEGLIHQLIEYNLCRKN